MDDVPELNENDIEKLGLALGDRKRVLKAIGAYQSALLSMTKQDRAFVDVDRAIASAYFATGEHELNLKHLGGPPRPQTQAASRSS